jgi:aspartyl-tRNA(Asn)/glutamyl-tRNA(Gln) amidotransferase subunit A
MGLLELRDLVARKEVKAREAVESALARMEATNPRLNSVVRLTPELALAAADRVDGKVAANEPLGALAGVPVGLKEIFLTRGVETTCCSNILRGHVPVYDATVVRRVQDADGCVVAKLNMDEFAMGSSTETSAFGPARNPWDTGRVPGGSSGGSAVAVASGQVVCALGTDTGGSIRQPASFCGVAGLKPTYGRVSRYGVIAYASSLDQVGPMARSVRDCAALRGVIAGHDPRDSTSHPARADDYVSSLAGGAAGVRAGVPREYLASGIDPEVERAIRRAVDDLGRLGVEAVEISLPHTEYAVACYYLIATAEASSNLARYDGVRFGQSRRGGGGLLEMYMKTRGGGFGPEVKRRIMLGTYVLSAGYYDAYYLKAQKVRTLIARDFERAFERVQVVVTPVAPTTAFRLGEKTGDPLQMYLADVYTLGVNLAGLPALSVPCGLSGDRLPIGMQLIGRPFDESTLLRVAHAYEQATGWHANRPPPA